ncbi:MAG: nuclear transport factor 2 family protein [Bacteriovoracaceae bacterium]
MLQQEKIKSVFNTLRADNLQILDDFYAPNTLFVDPLGKHEGLENVKKYYKGLYENVKDIRFETRELISDGNSHVFVWKMILVADGLNGGAPVTLEGNSLIKFNDQNLVIYHRDYFDMGEFIYEHIPVLGWTLKKIKQKLRGE